MKIGSTMQSSNKGAHVSRRPVASRRLAAALRLVTLVTAVVLLAPAGSALAASAPAFSVGAVASSPGTAIAAVRQGDGIQGGYDLGNVASFSNLDNIAVTITNSGSAPTNGPVTATLTLATGISVVDLLNSWQASTGIVTSGSDQVTSVTTTNAGYPFAVGNVLTGTGIPAGTTITGITGTSPNITLTLSASATATSVTAETLTLLPGLGTTSPTSTAISNVSGGPYAVGNSISGTGIPASDTITAVSGTSPNITLTLATAATASGTVSLTEAATRAAASGSGWTCTAANPSVCTSNATVAPGAAYPTIDIPVQVTTTAGVSTQDGDGGPVGTHVNFTPSITGGGAATASPVIPIPVVGIPNLATVETDVGPFRQGDSNDSYTMTVLNNGVGPTSSGSGSPAPNPIVVTATGVPASETPTGIFGAGWTCSLAATTAGVNGAVYTLPADSCYRTDSWPALASLPPIIFTVNIAGNGPASVNLVTAVSGGDSEASGASSATTTFPTTIIQAPDLVAQSVHVGSFTQGDAADTYELETNNIIGPNSTVGGPSTGTVTVTDAAPLGESITGMSGAGWTCTLTPPQLVQPPTVPFPDQLEPSGSCTRTDPLQPGSSYPNIHVTVAVTDDAQPSIDNTVTVSGGGMTTASQAGGGQTSTDATQINQAADLRVSAQQTTNGAATPSVVWTQGDGASVGDAIVLTANNYGYAPTSGPVTVVDRLPLDVSLVDPSSPATGSGWSCTIGATARIVTCITSASTTAGDALPSITIPVTVSDNAGTTPTNNITVSGGSTIDSTGQNTDEPLVIAQQPDLAVDVADSGNFEPGGTGSFAIVARNTTLAGTTGPVTLTYTLAPGLTATSISGTGWSCTLSTLTCTTSTLLPPGNSFLPVITVDVDISASATAPLSDTATVSGGGEVDLNNDTGTDSVGFRAISSGTTTQTTTQVTTTPVGPSNVVAPPNNSVSYTAPSVTTEAVSAITTTSATVSGVAAPGSAAGTYQFQYGTTKSYGHSTAVVALTANAAAAKVTAKLTKLKSGTTYHYRLVVSGVAGADKTFTTKKPAPRKLTLTASPKTDPLAPYKYKVSGTLTPPPGYTKSVTCKGTVTVSFADGKKVVARVRAKLAKTCRYSASTTIEARKLHGRGSLKVTANFGQNATLTAGTAKAVTVKFG
jgi:hypothetical protein